MTQLNKQIITMTSLFWTYKAAFICKYDLHQLLTFHSLYKVSKKYLDHLKFE